MQDLERMKAMMRAGMTDPTEFRSAGEDFGMAISAAGESLGEGVSKRNRKRVSKRQKRFNERVGSVSENLSRRRSRGSGM